jgi:hypothetical protein
MFCNLFTFAALPLVGLDRFIFPIALIMAVVSFSLRLKPIGGWLLYFYYWICVFLAVAVVDVAHHPEAYFSSSTKADLHLALIMATIPRLIAAVALLVTALFLAIKREWIWVERVRFGLIVTVLCAGISVAIDHYYFPRSVLPSGTRLAGLLAWTIYFFVSARVQAVFLTKTWEAEIKQSIRNSL